MVEAVQYVLIEMILSPNVHNRVKTVIDDSGIIPVTDSYHVQFYKSRVERMYDNVKRVGDTHYETVKDGILYKVHRYEYISMRPYSA